MILDSAALLAVATIYQFVAAPLFAVSIPGVGDRRAGLPAGGRGLRGGQRALVERLCGGGSWQAR
jgi:hypothetical protein